jgi:hypothetical protein
MRRHTSAVGIEPVEPGDMDPNKPPKPMKGLDPDSSKPAPATEPPLDKHKGPEDF